MTYDWESDSHLAGLTYPNGRKVTYQFDALDRVTSMNGTATYSYIGAYRVGERASANGISLKPEYDALRRTQDFIHNQNQNLLAGFCYR